MLVLSRKEHEKLVLTTKDGLEIIVCAVRIKGNRVRIGITAPKEVTIRRQELLEPDASNVEHDASNITIRKQDA